MAFLKNTSLVSEPITELITNLLLLASHSGNYSILLQLDPTPFSDTVSLNHSIFIHISNKGALKFGAQTYYRQNFIILCQHILIEV